MPVPNDEVSHEAGAHDLASLEPGTHDVKPSDLERPVRSTPYELRVGVTGHRDLEDPDAIAAAVDRLLDHVLGVLEDASSRPVAGRNELKPARLLVRLARMFWRTIPPPPPSRTPEERRTAVQLTGVSALARGADRIVARAVLRRPGARLAAVLPLPLDEYRTDFVAADDRREFEELLELDPRPEVAHTSTTDSEDGERLSDPDSRRHAYFSGGALVVERSEILIAVWDGEPSQGHGGTADVVAAALKRGRSVYWIHAKKPAEPARLLRPGRGVAASLAEAESGTLPETAKEISPNFHQLAAFNRDTGCSVRAREEIEARVSRELLEAAEKAKLPPATLATAIELFVPAYARADCLASRYQSLVRQLEVLLYGLAGVAVAIPVVQALFFSHDVWMVWGEVLVLLVVVILLRVGRLEHWHRKWLLDRQLAEQLRTATFLSVLRATPSRARFEDTLPAYQGPETWILSVPRLLLREAETTARADVPFASLRDFLVKGWIAAQAEWHGQTAERRRRLSKLAGWWSIGLFVSTMLLAALHALGVGHDDHGHATVIPNLLTMMTILLPVSGASVHAVMSLRDHGRIAERSHRMQSVLETIAQEGRECSGLEELRKVCLRAARVIATENHEWLATMSFREPELPA